MVGIDVSGFVAKLNYGLKTCVRCIRVENTVINRRLAFYLHGQGYFRAVRKAGKFLAIYPIYAHTAFSGVKAISVPSRPIFFGPRRIRKELRAGNRYILFSHTGQFCDSHDCLLSNVGGQAVMRLS